MPSFLVTYDLTGPERDYPKLITHLKSYGTYSHVLKSTWLIVTESSVKAVRDAAAKHIDEDDKLLVVKLTGDAAWRNLRAASSTWIKKHLKF